MNHKDPQTPTSSPFDAIRHIDEELGEHWSARELSKLLGYARFDKFLNVIAKAEEACRTSGQVVSDHMSHMGHMISTGKGAKREVEDVLLSRYGAYLVVQNADPSGKPIVALGQTYFAMQTRRQEIADELVELPEDQLRLLRRGQMNVYNTQLAETARDAGVVQPRDFAVFQDHGYKGLYGGLGARGIHQRKGLKKSQDILDHMESDELAANIFRASLTKQKLEREAIRDRNEANRTHHEMGQAVRKTIIETGATLPEDLPTPEKSIQQLQREEQKRIEQRKQPSLFDELPPAQE